MNRKRLNRGAGPLPHGILMGKGRLRRFREDTIHGECIGLKSNTRSIHFSMTTTARTPPTLTTTITTKTTSTTSTTVIA